MITRFMISRRVLLTVVLSLAAGTAPARAQPPLQNIRHAELTIVSPSGRHVFRVEVARTTAQMAEGLMFRRWLAADAGMIFEYKRPTIATMWMRNTLIPLDMIFVDARGRIVNIAERAVPLSDTVIAAAAPVTAVIEVNGGTAARLGIKSGDRVLNPFFKDSR